MFLEQQIQVGVREATGAPMFLNHNLTWQRLKLTAACSAFGSLSLSLGLLYRRDILPALIVNWPKLGVAVKCIVTLNFADAGFEFLVPPRSASLLGGEMGGVLLPGGDGFEVLPVRDGDAHGVAS